MRPCGMVRYVLLKSIPAERLRSGSELTTFEKLRGILEERVRTAPDEKARAVAELELRAFVKGAKASRASADNQPTKAPQVVIRR